VSGAQLSSDGYGDLNADIDYWFQRSWDIDTETWYVLHQQALVLRSPPMLIGQFSMGLALCRSSGFEICQAIPPPAMQKMAHARFAPRVETQIEIDYQLSQAGRGLKYSSDPTLLLKEPVGVDADIIKGAGNALVVSEKGMPAFWKSVGRRLRL